MKCKVVVICVLGVLFLFNSTQVWAQAEAPKTGLRVEVLLSLTDAENKLVALAEKFPQDKYGWRPMEGVRSPSEVFMHVAATNFRYPRLLGVQAPAGLPQNFEQVTEKAKVIDLLKQSFAFIKQSVMNLPDADLGKSVRVYGRDSTYEGVLIVMLQHAHEHLGQSIAYARMNHIVPPWTEEAEQRRQQAPKKSP